MKKFENPILDVQTIELADVITTSGTPECGIQTEDDRG